MPMKLFLVVSYNNGNIFLGLTEYKLNSLLCTSHLVDYHSFNSTLEGIY